MSNGQTPSTVVSDDSSEALVALARIWRLRTVLGSSSQEVPMVLKLNLSEDLAARLRHHRDALPRILELGLREMQAASQPGFQGLAEVLETLASLPTPEEVLELRPSTALEERIRSLLETNRAGGLSPDEEREWESYQYLEHLVRIAKAKALVHLNAS